MPREPIEDGGSTDGESGLLYGRFPAHSIRVLARRVGGPRVSHPLARGRVSSSDPSRRRPSIRFTNDVCTERLDAKRKKYWENRQKREITGRERETDQTATPVLKSKWPILFLAVLAMYPIAIVAINRLLRDEMNGWTIALFVAMAIIAVLPTLLLVALFLYCRKESEGRLSTAGRLIALWSKKITETTRTTAHETVGPTSIEFQRYFSDLLPYGIFRV